jgi:drug/metabolite transporter (DMT)-like permease
METKNNGERLLFLRDKKMLMRQIFTGTTFLAIMACLLWSTAFAGIKMGLPYTTPIQFAGLRFMLAGALLIPLAIHSGDFYSCIRYNSKFIFWVSLSQTFIQYALFYWGISKVPAGITAITVGAQPLFVAIVAHYMVKNETLSLKKTLSISLGITGIAFIAIKKGFGTDENTQLIWGLLLLILSNMASGIGNVYVSKHPKVSSAVALSSWQLMMGGLALFILSLFIEPFSGFIHPAAYYISLAWLSCLSATAFTIWFILLQRQNIKVSDLNIWKFIIPVSGAILSWLIVPGESPEIVTITGMIIIGLSLTWYNWLVRRQTS